jgi:hypothetical protein
MSNVNRQFVARAIYHHSKRTSEHVTLLIYKDSHDAYQLFDDRETEHDYLAGTKEYILEEWGTRNRQVIKDSFQRDNLSGENEFQQFI